MHTISRFEAKSAVNKGAVLNAGVRVSKILPFGNITLGSESDAIVGSKTDVNATSVDAETYTRSVRSECSLHKEWELFGTVGVAALHDSAESVASGANHHSLGIFDAVIVTGKDFIYTTQSQVFLSYIKLAKILCGTYWIRSVGLSLIS